MTMADFDLETHLKNFVGEYYEGLSGKEELLERIVDEAGNKRYVATENPEDSQYRFAGEGENGQKVFELEQLKDFPDLQSDEFKKEVYSTDSYEHNYTEDKAEKLVKRLAGNSSKVSQDLKNLLEHSNLHFRVRKNWKAPNGSCSFKKGVNGAKNEIVICLCDWQKFGDDELAGVLAHELGHALDFSKRPEGCQAQYMDGVETAVDLVGISLLANAGIDSRGFYDFMGKDYDERKEKKEETRMLYTPDGNYRRENYDAAFDVINESGQNQGKGSKNKSVKKQIEELSGRRSSETTPYKKQPISRESMQGLHYARNFDRGGR